MCSARVQNENTLERVLKLLHLNTLMCSARMCSACVQNENTIERVLNLLHLNT